MAMSANKRQVGGIYYDEDQTEIAINKLGQIFQSITEHLRQRLNGCNGRIFHIDYRSRFLFAVNNWFPLIDSCDNNTVSKITGIPERDLRRLRDEEMKGWIDFMVQPPTINKPGRKGAGEPSSKVGAPRRMVKVRDRSDALNRHDWRRDSDATMAFSQNQKLWGILAKYRSADIPSKIFEKKAVVTECIDQWSKYIRERKKAVEDIGSFPSVSQHMATEIRILSQWKKRVEGLSEKDLKNFRYGHMNDGDVEIMIGVASILQFSCPAVIDELKPIYKALCERKIEDFSITVIPDIHYTQMPI